MFRTRNGRLGIACVGAIAGAVLVMVTAPIPTFGQSRGQMRQARQYYSNMMRQRTQMLQKQFEEARKLAVQRQAQEAAEAARKLEVRKAAAEASRTAKEEKQAKTKEYYARLRNASGQHKSLAGSTPDVKDVEKPGESKTQPTDTAGAAEKTPPSGATEAKPGA